MEEKIIRRPPVTAVIKSSGVRSSVDWIDLESRRCKTTAGYESDIDNFYFVDSRDYDSLRCEYAGRAMQAMLGAVLDKPELLYNGILHDMKRNDFDGPAEMISTGAMAYADALIRELKRPKDFREMFGMR